jgi:hypothetical protein
MQGFADALASGLQAFVQLRRGERAVEFLRRVTAAHSAMGQEKYPSARRLLITADGGGSNGSRLRLWKVVVTIGRESEAAETTMASTN